MVRWEEGRRSGDPVWVVVSRGKSDGDVVVDIKV